MRFFILLWGIFFGASGIVSADLLVAPPQQLRAKTEGKETFRVLIENTLLGRVMVSVDRGNNWYLIGTVRTPISALRDIRDAEFTASDWGYVGAVAATAVNAIHVKVAQPGKHARIFSILPEELSGPKRFQTSYKDNASSIFVDIPGGTSLFSGRWGVRVGDPVLLLENGEWVVWPENRFPVIGDSIVLVARAMPDPEWYIDIENVKGGAVTFVTANGTPMHIAKVIQPITGSGRFLGTIFQEVGRVRANHPGVIDISTSPMGEQGGIQIIPYGHSKSPNLAYVHSTPVYLIVAPVAKSGPLEGQSPLFMGYIRPGDVVQARIAGKWQDFPSAIGRDFSALRHVEAMRIMPAVDK